MLMVTSDQRQANALSLNMTASADDAVGITLGR